MSYRDDTHIKMCGGGQVGWGDFYAWEGGGGDCPISMVNTQGDMFRLQFIYPSFVYTHLHTHTLSQTRTHTRALTHSN